MVSNAIAAGVRAAEKHTQLMLISVRSKQLKTQLNPVPFALHATYLCWERGQEAELRERGKMGGR